MNLLELEGIRKSFPSPSGGRISILDGVDLSLSEGEIVSIVGRSGSGKSTLLSIAALLSRPDEGSIRYSGRDVSSLDERGTAALRAASMGFVFQSSLLLSDFSAEENIAMPLMIQGMKRQDALHEAARYLELVGLSEARAIAGNPLVIFADEPTGSLDEKSAAAIETILLDAVRSTGHSLLFVTHDLDFAAKADRRLELMEGVLCDA